mgnify:CR=1 FL=1
MSKRKDHWHPGTPIETEDGAPVVGTSMGFLDNPGAQRVSRVAALASRRARTKHGRFLVEGPQGVREAVAHQPSRVQDLYITQQGLERHSDVLAAAQDADVYVHLVSDEVMAAMSTDAQGVLAVVATASGADAPTGIEALAALLTRLDTDHGYLAVMAYLDREGDSPLAGVDEALAREAMRRAQHKLPMKTRFVTREGGDV